MSTEEVKKMTRLLKEALENPRSTHEITATFQAAGIIDHKGNLKEPYKNIFIPVKHN